MTFIKKLYDANSQFDDIVQTIDNSVPSGGEGSIQLKSATGKLSSISTWLKRKTGLSDYALTGTSSFVETTNSEDLVLYQTNEYNGSTAGGTWYTPESPQENDFFTVDLSSYTENNILIDIHPNDLGTFDLLDSSSESPVSEDSITLTQGNVYYFWLKENSWFYSDTAFPERLSLYSSEKLNIGSTDNPVTDLFVSNKIRLDTLDIFASNIVLEKTFTSPEVTAGPISGETSYSDALISLNSVLTTSLTSSGFNNDGTYTANGSSNYLTAATSLQDADNKLDARVKTNADAIADNTSDIAALSGGQGLTGIQTEVDAIETGVGLDGAGAYVAPNGSNYIDNSTSVMDALDKLDSALKVVSNDDSGDDAAIQGLDIRLTTAEGEIETLQTDVTDLQTSASDIQSELGDTQTGAGLDADGGYTANAGSNYLTAATSLKDADTELDAQIKVNADAIALKASQADLDTAEADIATNAGDIATNAGNITTNSNDITDLYALADEHETAIGLNGDGTYSAHTTSNYINSATTTKSALGLLDAEIKTNADDITTINTTIANLTSEGDTNSDAITALQTELDSTQTGAGLSGNGNYTAPGASNYLGTATSLKSADNLLDAAIKSNEDDIGTNVTDIATNATSITTLSGRVTTAEGDITAVEGRLDTAEADITSIEGDITTLQGVDTDLQDEINLTQTGAGLEADGDYTADATTNYLTAASSLKDADKKLDTQVKANADAIALRALDADLDDIDTRVTTVEGDITSLEGRMDTAETDITSLETLADTHETSLGLNEDGTRPAYSSTAYISGTHHNALGQLDAQVGTNAGNITTNANDITSLETLADTHETSLGLNEDGSRPVYSSTTYISGTHHNALGQLDAQVGTNAGNITTNSNNISSLDTLADTHESAIGLNDNGTYTAPAGTNYLGGATSIRNESVKLDTQVKTNTDAISSEATARANADTALQTEVDAIETAVGLSANGTKTDFSSANYIVAAGTFKAAIEALDGQLKTTQDDLDIAEGEIDTLQSDLDAAEVTIAAHTTLLDKHESSIGLNTDGSYTAIVGNYATDNNLKAAVGSLDSQVKTNADNIALKASQASLNTLQIEVDAIENAVGINTNGTFNGFTTSNYMNASTSTRGALLDLDGQVKTNADAISAETTNRTNADSAIQTELDNTQAGAGLGANGSYTTPAGHTYLGGASLKADIANLDTQLASTQSDLDTAEASLATAQGDITDLETLADTHETSIGLNADGSRPNYSSNFYVANTDDIVTAIGELDTAINGVAGADLTNLQDEVDAIETGAGLNADGTYTAIGDATYISAATSLKDADDRLDAALAAEATERANADSAFDQYIAKFLVRGGGIFWDDNSADAVEMDASLTMMKSHLGPFEVNINDLVTSNASDIVFYGERAYANSDKNFEVIGDGSIEFTGKYSLYPIP
jgi:hypothetical protein